MRIWNAIWIYFNFEYLNRSSGSSLQMFTCCCIEITENRIRTFNRFITPTGTYKMNIRALVKLTVFRLLKIILSTSRQMGLKCRKLINSTFEFFLNCRQHKVGISANFFFPFISIVKLIMISYKFGGKCYLIF